MATPLRRRSSRGRGPLIFAGIVVLALLLFSSTGFYTDVLWFREVGIASVLWTSIPPSWPPGSRSAVVAAVVYVNLLIAGRMASAYSFFRIEEAERRDPLDRYRMSLSPYIKWLRLAAGIAIGLLAGLGASSSWQTFALYLNRVPFGGEDPQFGRYVGFYVSSCRSSTHLGLGLVRDRGRPRGVAHRPLLPRFDPTGGRAVRHLVGGDGSHRRLLGLLARS